MLNGGDFSDHLNQTRQLLRTKKSRRFQRKDLDAIKSVVNRLIKELKELIKESFSIRNWLHTDAVNSMKPLNDTLECHNSDTMRNLLKRIHSSQQQFLCLTVYWGNQVAEALNHLQILRKSRDICYIRHGDLTLDSVFVDEHLNAKITRSDQLKTAIASLESGPEQRIAHEAHVDRQRKRNQPDDRYQYSVFIVELFCEMSLKKTSQAYVEELLSSVRAERRHSHNFDNLVEKIWIQVRSDDRERSMLAQLKSAIARVLRITTSELPESSDTMAAVSELWQSSGLFKHSFLDREIAVKAFRRPNNENVDLKAKFSTQTSFQTKATVQFDKDSQTVAKTTTTTGKKPITVTNQPEYQQTFIPSISKGGLTISISAMVGDQLSSSSGEVRQTMPAMLGDEVDLLTRNYSSEAASDVLIERLCCCSEVVQRGKVLLFELGCSMIDMKTLTEEQPSAGQGDTLLRRLLEQKFLSAGDLGSAFKKCGCLSGLRILREFEGTVGPS